MQYQLRTEHIELTSSDQEQLDKKLDRLHKHLKPPYITDITFIRDTHHRTGNIITCIINVQQGKDMYHAERSNGDIQTALDQALKAIGQEMKNNHDKETDHRGPSLPEAIDNYS